MTAKQLQDLVERYGESGRLKFSSEFYLPRLAVDGHIADAGEVRGELDVQIVERGYAIAPKEPDEEAKFKYDVLPGSRVLTSLRRAADVVGGEQYYRKASFLGVSQQFPEKVLAAVGLVGQHNDGAISYGFEEAADSLTASQVVPVH